MPQELLKIENISRSSVLASRMEKADSFFSRGRGLLGRTDLEPGGGLWIIPGNRIHMCGMQFALDIVFINRQLRVTAIYEDIQPQPRWAIWRTWGGGKGAYSVLELPVGAIRQSNTNVGDQLQMEPSFS